MILHFLKTLSSNIDVGSVYRPPNSLQFPKGMEPKPKEESCPGSPNSSSSSQSDLSFSPTLKKGSQFEFSEKDVAAHIMNKTDSFGSDVFATAQSSKTDSSVEVVKHISPGNNSKKQVRIFSYLYIFICYCLTDMKVLIVMYIVQLTKFKLFR